MTPASQKSTISPDVLHVFVLAGSITASSVANLDDPMLRTAIESLAVVEPAKYDLGSFEIEVAKLCIEKSDKAETLCSQVWAIILKYQKLLTSHGYSNFLEKQAKIAVQHVLQILPNGTLRKRMALNLRLRKEELQADFTKFVRECANEAEAIDRHEIARRAEDPRKNKAQPSEERAKKPSFKRDGREKKPHDTKGPQTKRGLWTAAGRLGRRGNVRSPTV